MFRVDEKMYGRKKKLIQIVNDETRAGSDKTWTTTHAFVDPENGDLYKPSGRSPAKNPVHNLLNDESYQWVLNNCTWTGSELYLNKARRDWTVL